MNKAHGLLIRQSEREYLTALIDLKRQSWTPQGWLGPGLPPSINASIDKKNT